jgi:hypothetical protein
MYLVYRHGAGIVLVGALCIHELGHERILATVSRRAGCRRRREIVAVEIVRGNDFSETICLGLGALWLRRVRHDCVLGVSAFQF